MKKKKMKVQKVQKKKRQKKVEDAAKTSVIKWSRRGSRSLGLQRRTLCARIGSCSEINICCPASPHAKGLCHKRGENASRKSVESER